MSPLQHHIQKHRQGNAVGITSVCCSHEQVLRAALQAARQQAGSLLLIEATSNQVDQYGGYTGMKPAQFMAFARQLATQQGLAPERLVLGGDHLGPNAWQHRPAAEAMAHARELIRAYVQAGFHKIHLDCSMACADDPARLLDDTVAARAVELAQVAEQAAQQAGLPPPVYVIGTEVPIPGGESALQGGVAVTTPQAAQQTLHIHAQAFAQAGLQAAWSRVIAMVVQPGVDFDPEAVQAYAPAAAARLSDWVAAQAGLVFEAHSTDYQSEPALHALVRDHFAILKVGPAATFALREALFALAAIEREWLPLEQQSQLPQVLEQAMLAQPRHWARHYPGDTAAQRLQRRFALSDRVRYYWGEPAVQQAVERLIANLRARPLPQTLLSQFLPDLLEPVRAGRLAAEPWTLARERVQAVLRPYLRACHRNQAQIESNQPEILSEA